jgi:hypothetical protein
MHPNHAFGDAGERGRNVDPPEDQGEPSQATHRANQAAGVEERLLEPSYITLAEFHRIAMRRPVTTDAAEVLRQIGTLEKPLPRFCPSMPQRPWKSLAFVAFESVLLAVAAAFGGPAWTGMMVLALLVEVSAGSQLAGLAWLVPALGWLAPAVLTANRELFFPYSMAVAAFMACRLRQRSLAAAGWAAAAGVLVFLGIRFAQQATWQVLATESMVAGGILLMIVGSCRWLPERPWQTGLVMAVASGLAYAGLAL